MRNTYLDNPLKVEEEIEKLSPSEYRLFTKGYLLALLNVIDHLVDIKSDIYEGLMSNGDSGERLQSILRVLEAMETHYAKRANNLELELQTANK